MKMGSMEGSPLRHPLPDSSWPQGLGPLIPIFPRLADRAEERKASVGWAGAGTDGKRCRLVSETEGTCLSVGTRSAHEGREREGNEVKEMRVQGGEVTVGEEGGVRLVGWRGLNGADSFWLSLCSSLTSGCRKQTPHCPSPHSSGASQQERDRKCLGIMSRAG